MQLALFMVFVSVLVCGCKSGKSTIQASCEAKETNNSFISRWNVNVNQQILNLEIAGNLFFSENFDHFSTKSEIESASLTWGDAEVSLSVGDGFIGAFQNKSISEILNALSFDDPLVASDDAIRNWFLEGKEGGFVEAEDELIIIRYREGRRNIDGVIVNKESQRFCHFVGLVKRQPTDWKEIAKFMLENIELR
jgi:hypothetical protein